MPPQRPARLLLAVVSTLALCFAPAPASAGRGRFDVTRFGVRPDGKTDVSAPLQKIIDALTGPSTLDFPAGEYLFTEPVYVDKPYVHIRGAGRKVTVLKTPRVDFPPLVFGFRRVEKGGARVTRAHRPDAFGTLDATVAPARGAFHGFSTEGNAGAISVAGPAQCGQVTPRQPGSHNYDYYGEMRGLTVEMALRFPDAIETARDEFGVLGLGSLRCPGPWRVSVDSAKRFVFSFRTDDGGVDGLDPWYAFAFRLPASTSRRLNRVRIWVDFDTGAYGAAVNGREMTLEYPAKFPPLKGKRLARNRGQYPFFIGPLGVDSIREDMSDRVVPRFEIAAFRVSRVACRSEPRTDRDRYLSDPDTVVFLDGKSGTPARHMMLGCGPPTAVTACASFICSTKGTIGGIQGNSVQDLSVVFGSPGIAIGGVLDFSMRDVEAEEGFQGLGSIPTFASYPITLTNCLFAGTDVGINLCTASVRLFSVDIQHGGPCYARFVACNVDWFSGMGRFLRPDPETGIDLIRGWYGGTYSFIGLQLDNEEFPFSDSVMRVDFEPLGTTLYVRNLYAAMVGEKATVFHLVGLRGRGGEGGVIDVGSLILGDRFGRAKSALRVSGGDWAGQADLRGASVQNVEGEAPGIDIIKGRRPRKPGP